MKNFLILAAVMLCIAICTALVWIVFLTSEPNNVYCNLKHLSDCITPELTTTKPLVVPIIRNDNGS